MDQKSALRRADSFKSPAIFTVNITNFDRFCKCGTEKAFSDLAYIRELPWQIFATAEYIDLKINSSKVAANNTDPKARSHNSRHLIVYLQCNGQIGNQEFQIGKRAPAFATVTNTLFSDKTINQKFSCSINEEEHWAKIDLGAVEEFFEPGFIQVDGSLTLTVKISARAQ